MTTQPDTIGPLAVALDAREKGIVAIPCHPGTKVPKVNWKAWQTEMPPVETQTEWFRDTRVNIALVCTGMVTFDCEEMEKAELILREVGDTPDKVVTGGGGIHLTFRKRLGWTIYAPPPWRPSRPSTTRTGRSTGTSSRRSAA